MNCIGMNLVLSNHCRLFARNFYIATANCKPLPCGRLQESEGKPVNKALYQCHRNTDLRKVPERDRLAGALFCVLNHDHIARSTEYKQIPRNRAAGKNHSSGRASQTRSPN